MIIQKCYTRLAFTYIKNANKRPLGLNFSYNLCTYNHKNKNEKLRLPTISNNMFAKTTFAATIYGSVLVFATSRIGTWASPETTI